MFVSVLGIDPGLTRCGYGIVRKGTDHKIEFVRVGIFSTSPQELLSARLAEMHTDIVSLIEEVKPDEIAIERILFQNNATTAMSVAQVSGLVHAVAATYSIPVTEYSPNEVKNAITGDGKADKKQIQTMVTRLLGLQKFPQPADAADALAIAMTHAVGVGDKKSDNAIYNGSKLHNAIADAIERQGAPKKKRETKRKGLSR